MTATRDVGAPQQLEAPGQAAVADGGLSSASLPEAVVMLLTGVVPALVRGLFSPRRSAMKVLTALNADGRAISALSAIRRRHEGEGVRLLGGRLVVLWGPAAIREVLDRSAELFAGDAGAKGKGMDHFQPDALTRSRGEDWRDRRNFTEHVLASGDRVHPFGERFLAVVADEVDRLRLGDTLQWHHWEQLFDHLTLRVIFGDGARDDQRMTELLEGLMAEANRLVGLSRGDEYYEFYGELERHLREPGPESLVAQLAEAPQSVRTRVVQQLPHWMFAMRDTLAANTYRALAVIAADPRINSKVCAEFEGKELEDSEAVDQLRYLEGCLHEAMRLWPTTPLLARETTQETELAGEHLEAGTQVMLLNVFNHRDPAHVEDADRLVPERWANVDDERDYRFNHLSNGTQDCPGGPLVLFLGKAVIANVMRRYELELERPRLDSDRPLPPMLDFFDACFAVHPRPQP